jgi:hypothetical protein
MPLAFNNVSGNVTFQFVDQSIFDAVGGAHSNTGVFYALPSELIRKTNGIYLITDRSGPDRWGRDATVEP